jgi:DNA-binding MarR family transcriptional regulator
MPNAPRTIYLIRQAQLAVSALLQEAMQKFDLTASQYTILSIVCNRPGISSADLARRISVTPQSINEVISSLERLRLVSRQEAPDNRRILKINITPAGKRLLASCDKVVDDIEAGLFSSLSQRELGALDELLQKVLTDVRAGAKISA